ncbi:hypothetical protein EPUS_01239 [Endocarpon pusillum Z07020]|uniref:Heterokaryon incompatibility domain-containing protein n=1 Tax=Endocarpon pusillum (strain Z07020 / HMAS-L-300199) TaxID=1263415 RepID=U1GTW8_ENDPU|nr:uncharacterized protein EPUS_01239 [Endocarpon pusillum Z07020]ERF75873.1 hypothetical protein EPUS_01239 [Endocarpon pusillum Z07020]
MADRVLAIGFGGAHTHLSALSLKRGISFSSFKLSLSPLDRVLTVALLLLLLLLFATTTEAAHYSKCCVLGARDQLNIFTEELPWDVCHYNKTVSYPADPVSPSVNRTKGWCINNCQGAQWSNATQWIQPLASWIAPYTGLLLLCPVGGKPEKTEKKRPERSEEPATSMTGDEAPPAHNPALKSGWMTNRFHWQKLRTTCQEAYTWCCNAAEYLRFPAQEYVMLIGDPASALWGSFAELQHDRLMVRDLSRPSRLEPRLRQTFVIMVDDTVYDPDLTRQLGEKIERVVSPPIHPGELLVEQKMTYDPVKTTAVDTINEKDPQSVSTINRVAATSNILVHDYDYKSLVDLERALRSVVEARVPFITAIALPAVLMLAVVAYDAYNKLGDNDTVHSIAYGVFYSWIVVLAVVGNCAATSVNAGVLDNTLGGVVGFKFHPQVPLRKRYSNAVRWSAWRYNVEGRFWVVLPSPLLHWPGAGVAGRGVVMRMRGVDLVHDADGGDGVSVVHLRLVEMCDDADPDSKRTWTRLDVAVRYVYGFLVLCNACLLVLGTVFNLAGLYRTCRCKLLFASMDALVELNTNTQQYLDNARKFWYPVGYVVFTLVWILCAMAVALRKHMTLHLLSALERRRNGLPFDRSGSVPLDRGVPLGYSDDIEANVRCPLCRIVADAADTLTREDDREVEFWFLKPVFGYEVLTFGERRSDPAAHARQKATPPTSSVYLGVARSFKMQDEHGFGYYTSVSSIYIGLLNQAELTGRTDWAPRLHDLQSVDFEMIKNWLSRCRSHETCNQLSPASGHGLTLRVLDTKLLQVIDLPHGSPYIALSYVLGGIPPVEQKAIYKLSELPRFLQDAIAVANALSHRYIWTDYLCISNTDSLQRTADIERMGTIYRQAFATIINAPTWDNPQGIPGVNDSDRWVRQSSEQFDGMTLVTSHLSLGMVVKSSAWGRRGWIFQEGLMSPRCIVFGPEQVYYQCAGGIWCESMLEPLSNMSQSNSNASFQGTLRDPFLDESSDSTSLYWSLVEDYTSRNLTFPNDSLRGFKGFLEYFSTLRNMSFFWGLPNTPSLSRNLLWSHTPAPHQSVTRRPDFPSWSWAGWSGTASLSYLGEEDPQTVFTMGLEYDGNGEENAAGEENRAREGNVAGEKSEGFVLRCTADVATVPLSVKSASFARVSNASYFDLNCGTSEGLGFNKTRHEYMEVYRDPNFTYGLLLRPRADDQDVFERMGNGWMDIRTLALVHPSRKTLKLG